MNLVHRESQEMMVRLGRLAVQVTRVCLVGVGFLVNQDPRVIDQL